MPLFYIRLTFKRRGDDNLYLPLIETTLEETEAMIKGALKGLTINPFDKHLTTTIEIRENTNGVNGKYKQVSFKGLSTQETKARIIKYIDSLNSSN